MSETSKPEIVLILRADGSIEMPTARTYGQALAIMAVIERAAQAVREQAFAQPMPQAQKEQHGPS